MAREGRKAQDQKSGETYTYMRRWRLQGRSKVLLIFVWKRIQMIIKEEESKMHVFYVKTA